MHGKLSEQATWFVGPTLAVFAAVAGGCESTATHGEGASAPDLSGGNLVKNADFETGASLPWTPSFSPPAKGDAVVEDGWYCLKVENKGKSPWDAQVRHREMTVQKGHTYSISFKIKADQPTRVRTKIGKAGPPFTEYWVETLKIGPQPQTITGQFTMDKPDDPTVEFAFHGGGTMALPEANYSFCIDDVYLTDPEFTPGAEQQAEAISPLRVNQHGYLPQFAKYASLVADGNSPIDWELVDSAGSPVLNGQTLPFGLDKDSGDNIHTIDFTAYQKEGDEYRLRAAGAESPPFRIGKDLYGQVKYDAIWFFYQNRSGIPIQMPYAGNPEWERPAGHLSDRKVACAPADKLFASQKDYACDWSLDVSGGWYDAGDHGKYVVNGGISLWTLLNLYERMKYLAPQSLADFKDGKLRVPERGNGVSDLLDEARWEMEWMLKMQVPDGKKYEGMAHHKIHDASWTALGLRPPTDSMAEISMPRYLRPPSTAATLNLAAVAAQASRIWNNIDPAFSKRCKTAAMKAWNAAAKHRDMLAPKEDTMGGGPYDDQQLSDEFYWAAAELYITTGHQTFGDYVRKSKWYLEIPHEVSGDGSGTMSAMTWQLVAALGTISIATVPSKLGKEVVKTARSNVIATADEYLKATSAQGYRIPFRAPKEGYPWGSNSFIINNMVVLGLARDFSTKRIYVDGMLDGLNYLLGNNPLGQSYVTGYGDRPLQNPHHRWWSFQYNNEFPKAIPGLLSGGPNSGLQDPYVTAANVKKQCEGRPQRCFIDNIEAWSVNEITINWNAPFVWVTAFLDEQAKG